MEVEESRKKRGKNMMERLKRERDGMNGMRQQYAGRQAEIN